ncbi:MAG: ABC transporter permease [Lachnospiraceae bacterium]|nr:ABC transporter permease [Lachnospiraceae bacterium]
MAWIWRLCITNMKNRGIRTILTILGVVIGVISIVSLVAVGIGAKELIMQGFDEDSICKIEVTGMEESHRRDKMITDDFLEEISGMENVKEVYPVLGWDVEIEIDQYTTYAQVCGVPQTYLDTLVIKEGEYPSGNGLKPELIIGAGARNWFYDIKTWSAVEELEEEKKPNFVGKRAKVTIYQDNIHSRMEICGMTDNEYDYNIYCELESLKKYLKRNSGDNIIGQPTNKDGQRYNEWIYDKAYVYVEDTEYVDAVIEKLNNRGFQTYNEKEYVDSMNRILQIAQVVLAGIGMIALVVAVIGISNTMMTAVYDRIREIGILKVLGCDTDELLYLFLLESGILGAIGGVLGVGISYLITGLGVNKIAEKVMKLEAGEHLAVIPWWLALAAILFAICLGVIAGYFPARWAAKLRPIQAMNK